MERSRLQLVLDVVNEFDATGGASLELVAWELSVSVETIRAVWEVLVDRGLLCAAGPDDVFGEATYRITPQGRVFLATAGGSP